MALETGTYISDLVSTNPTSSDPKSQGDDHIRFVKAAVLATFPNISGAVTPTHTELNYVDGVTSAIQTQIDTKSPIVSPTFTGTPAAPTAATGTSTTQLATTEFVANTAMIATLPGQSGANGKLVTSDGTNASWTATINATVMSWADGADPTKKASYDLSGITTATTRTITLPDASFVMVGDTVTQTLTNKTLQTPVMQDSGDATKKASFVLSGISTATTRTITVANNNITLDTPAWKLITTVTASNSATVDVESIDSTYDNYMIIADNITVQTTGSLLARYKISGSYVTSADYSYHTHHHGYTGTPSVYEQENAEFGTSLLLGTADSGSNKVSALRFVISNPSSTTFWKCYDSTFRTSSSDNMLSVSGGRCNQTGALTGIRFLMASGNIVTGTFRLYGLRNT